MRNGRDIDFSPSLSLLEAMHWGGGGGGGGEDTDNQTSLQISNCTKKGVKVTFVISLHSKLLCTNNWAATQENLSSMVANNKGADQPAHPGSLISAFVIQVLESIISGLAMSEISIF